MRKKLLPFAFLLTLPFFVTACTLQDLPLIGKFFGGDGDISISNEPVTLNVWGIWEKAEVMDVLISKYQETHPNVTIMYDDRSIVGVSSYKDAVFGRASSEGAPDIVMVHNSWVAPLRGYLAASESYDTLLYTESFYPVASKDAVFDGAVYAVPLYYEGLMLVYNKDHFDELDQVGAPTAWEEFRTLALQLAKRDESTGAMLRAGAAMGSSNNIDFFSDILGLMFMQAGVSIPEDLDSRSAADALDFYTDFLTEYRVWEDTMPEASTAFAQGKVSMIFVPSWNLLNILEANPNLNIGVAPVPQALPEEPVSWASYWMFSVPLGGTNQEVSWQFLEFLATEEAQLMYFNEASKYRRYGPPFSLKALQSQATAGAYYKPILDTAPFAKSGSIAARSGNKNHVQALKDAVTNVNGGSVPAAEALKAAKSAIVNSR